MVDNSEPKVLPFDACLGADINGIDISHGLAPEIVDLIEAALAEHLVLRFRNQRVTDPQLLSFSRYFGELDLPAPNPLGQPFHKEYPEIDIISNVIKNGVPLGNLGDGEVVWHADMTFNEVPPKASLLYGREIPDTGSNTYFANMYAAYDSLPGVLKEQIDGRIAIHDASHNSAGMTRLGYNEITDVRETPGARHPLVRTHQQTGRKCLFLGRRPRAYIIGLELEESEALLDTLWEYATQSEVICYQEWRAGDLIMWDNASVLHRRDAFDKHARRTLHRTQIKGTEYIN